MRILQVVTDTDHRGAQVSAVGLAPGLVRRGHAVETVALAPGSSAVALPIDVLGNARLARTTVLELRARSRTADVVIAHGSTTLPACAVGLIGVRTPFVYRQVSDSLVWASTPARRIRVAAALKRAALVVALGDAQRQVLRQSFGVHESKLRVIPNAASSTDFVPADERARSEAQIRLGIPTAKTVVLSVGALVPEKGVDRIIAALAALDDPSVFLLVVGEGPEAGRLREQARAMLGEMAAFVGALVDVRVAYSAADLFVLSSHTESMPTVLIEAALAGLPVIATDVGAVKSVVQHDCSGILVPQLREGDVDELMRAVRPLVRDRRRREVMGENGRARALERFSVDSVVPVWEEVLADAHERN